MMETRIGSFYPWKDRVMGRSHSKESKTSRKGTERGESGEVALPIMTDEQAVAFVRGIAHGLSLHRADPGVVGTEQEFQTLLEERKAGGLHGAQDAKARLRSTLELAADVLDDPGPWLRAPNAQLGDRRPIDLVGTEEEFRVANLLVAIDQSLF